MKKKEGRGGSFYNFWGGAQKKGSKDSVSSNVRKGDKYPSGGRKFQGNSNSTGVSHPQTPDIVTGQNTLKHEKQAIYSALRGGAERRRVRGGGEKTSRGANFLVKGRWSIGNSERRGG